MPPGPLPISHPPALPAAGVRAQARHARAPEPITPRPVERCERACDRFERGTPDAFDAPPGAVPYWRYIHAQNTAHRLREGMIHRALLSSGGAETARPKQGAAPVQSDGAGTRPDAPRLGDVTPVRPEPALGAPEVHRVVAMREAATGRIFDAVF